MPGKLCDGTINLVTIKDSKACCEGALARTQSTTPTNPHAVGSDAYDSWESGVLLKAGGQDPACCAPCGPAAV